MNEYVLRIQSNGMTFEETIHAFLRVWAMQIAEARYGKGCVVSCVREVPMS